MQHRPPLQVSVAGLDGGGACVELRHAAEAGGQHGAAEALPPACATSQGCQAQWEAGEALREPPCRRQDQTGGSGTQRRVTLCLLFEVLFIYAVHILWECSLTSTFDSGRHFQPLELSFTEQNLTPLIPATDWYRLMYFISGLHCIPDWHGGVRAAGVEACHGGLQQVQVSFKCHHRFFVCLSEQFQFLSQDFEWV